MIRSIILAAAMVCASLLLSSSQATAREEGSDVLAGGDVVVQRYLCPPGFGVDRPRSLEEYQRFCSLAHAGQRVSVAQGEDVLDAGMTDGDGRFVASGAESGPMRLSEFPREGFPQPAVFCRAWPPTATPGTYAPQEVQGWAFDLEASGSLVIDCLWYTSPPSDQAQADQPSTLILHGHDCAETVDLPAEGGVVETLVERCPASSAGVGFTIARGDGAAESVTTSGDGSVTASLAPGDLTIAAQPRDDAAPWRAFCRSYRDGADVSVVSFLPATMEDGTVAWSPTGGFTFECRWFAVLVAAEPTPEPTEAVTITPLEPEPTAEADLGALVLSVAACDPEFDVYREGADPGAACADPLDDATVTLAGPDGELTAEAAGGEVRFDGLAAGTYLLQLRGSADGAGAFVGSCQSDQRDLATEALFVPLAYLGPDGQIGVMLRAGETLACAIFVVPGGGEPADQGTAGNLTITAYACPDATTPAAECPVYTAGTTITLIDVDDPGASPLTGETGPDGTVTLPAAGRYALGSLPAGTICRTASTAFDFSGNLAVEADQEVTASIYICGLEPEG